MNLCYFMTRWVFSDGRSSSVSGVDQKDAVHRVLPSSYDHQLRFGRAQRKGENQSGGVLVHIKVRKRMRLPVNSNPSGERSVEAAKLQ